MKQICIVCGKSFETEGVHFERGVCEFCLESEDPRAIEMVRKAHYEEETPNYGDVLLSQVEFEHDLAEYLTQRRANLKHSKYGVL